MEEATILVVNDDIIYLEMMTEVLKDEGYLITTYTRISEALPLILEQPPHLLIVDLRFPDDLQGIDLITMLRLHRHTQSVPVIVCTAAVNELTQLQEDLHRAGAALLRKPFLLDDLLSMISIMLHGGVGGATGTALVQP